MPDATWRRYLRFWRPNVAADIDDELRFHFTERIDALVAAGVTRAEARRQVEREFGDVLATKRGLRAIDERVMATRRRANRFDRWWQDLAYSARGLRRTPGVTLTVIVTLALGIGLNATLFSLLDRVFLRPPSGVAQPDGVRRLYWTGRGMGNETLALPHFAIPTIDAICEATSSTAAITMYRVDRLALGEDPGDPKAVVARTGPGYFALLGVHPGYGRFFSPEEERLDVSSPLAVVSAAFWSRRVGGSPADAIGQSIVLEKQRYTVIGVAPSGFAGPDLDAVDVWLPLGTFDGWGARVPGQPPWYQEPRMLAFQILARPRAGVSSAQLEAAAGVGANRALASASRRPTKVLSGPLLAARGPETRDQSVAIAERLGGVALIVLLIACANVANLLIVRSLGRGREFAIRAALGIDRRGIARLVLLETLLLSAAAGIVALVVATWSGTALRVLLFPDVSWRADRFDWRVALFSLAAALTAGLLAGLAPAAQSSGADVSEMLKTGGRTAGRPRGRLRAGLIVAQSALSMVLLVGAALFVRSLHAVRGLDLGYDVQRLVFVSLHFDSRDRDVIEARRAAGLPIVAARLASFPGVEKVALSSLTPMYDIGITSVFYASGDTLPRGDDGIPSISGVSPEFFAATGIHLRRGRLLEPADAASTPRVAVVNETFARTTWPHESAIGQCLRLGKPTSPCLAVVGVVEDARRSQLIEQPTRQLYVAAPRTGDYAAGTLIIRVPPSRAAALDVAARRAVAAAIPGARAEVLRMADVLAPQYRPWQLGASLFTVFGLLALLIAAVGIFSVVSHDVGQRRRELGVRVALGASVADVVRLVLGGGVRVVAFGVVVGVVAAVAASRLIASLLYGVAPRDPVVLSGVAVVLLAVAGLASALPAWRASRADPMDALRVD
jgi:putative ABC transport system permease protein